MKWEELKPCLLVPKEAWRFFKWRYLLTIWILLSTLLTLLLNIFLFGFSNYDIRLWLTCMPVLLLFTSMPSFLIYILFRSSSTTNSAQDVKKLITFNDKSFQKRFGNQLTKRIPIEEIHEAYFNLKINFKKDLLETLYQRDKFANYNLTWNQCKFFVLNLIPEFLIHSRAQDRAQVTNHYDRGNDFFYCFLGESMIYTSAFFKDPNDSLEVAQRQKMDLVCRKLHLKRGDKHLDLGCGWGTLICFAAKYYGTHSTGVTLAKEQVKWAKEAGQKMGVSNRISPLCCDYRDAPREKYNAISCLEMAEHVGMRYFQSFLKQVYDMLEDDGLFYLQICGLRRSWTFEDLNWGLFMGKYIFPGADASMPVYWVISELEKAGFEVHSIDNIGIHYSRTINYWYNNWKSNEEYIKEHYGERWWRIWYWFLAWSTIIPKAGTSTCYQIVCHKNLSGFNRSIFVGEQETFEYSKKLINHTHFPVLVSV